MNINLVELFCEEDFLKRINIFQAVVSVETRCVGQDSYHSDSRSLRSVFVVMLAYLWKYFKYLHNSH